MVTTGITKYESAAILRITTWLNKKNCKSKKLETCERMVETEFPTVKVYTKYKSDQMLAKNL